MWIFRIVVAFIFMIFLTEICQSAPSDFIRDRTEHALKKLFQCYLHQQQNINGMDRVVNEISRNCAETMASNGLSYSDLRD